MPKKFRIEVFGKPGCDKCAVLNKRLEQILQDDKWRDFEKIYQNIETIDGLVAFAQTECMNPSRIPGFVIQEWNAETKRYSYVSQTVKADAWANRSNLLGLYLGLETDYSENGRGVLAPKAIESVLQAALVRSGQ